ncbi:MAG: transglycosylase domain-containing protein [Acidobacteria bacterium]|nr:transglycosylase domain-containing protein [Acidobacteriota bacterium]
MAIKVRLEKPKLKISWPKLSFSSWLVRGVIGFVLLVGIVIFSVFLHYYNKYAKVVDERLKQPLFAETAKIFAAPREVRPGQKLTAHVIAAELRAAGYSIDGLSHPSQMGTFTEEGNQIIVRPGPQSYHAPDAATIRISKGEVQSVTDDKGQSLASYELEPLLITGLSEDANRTKRRLVTYDEIPPNLVQAVLAIEDRRFFEHGGVNYFSMAGWAWHDIIGDRKHRGGASTVTMQLAKLLFVADTGTIKYKISQILVAFHLEHRFTKKQIFEAYSNQINLGQRGSFSIQGFGEAAQVYFGKDVRQLDLAECAMLAGIIQRPNYFNPFRHPERTIERRNLVLDSMVETGSISKSQAERAKADPLHLVPGSVDASEAPYFVDIVRDQLIQKLGDRDFNREGLRIYTSLDPDLQRLATTSVDETQHIVEAAVDRKHARDRKLGKQYTYPQVALVALDPHTGQVLALVGGKNYGASQVNHAIAHRPTGSIFKPFVFAAAFQTAVQGTVLPGQNTLFSPVTILNDSQQTYDEGTENEYTPRNFEGAFYGDITARFALLRSDNNATISLASMVGFDQVAALARDSGIKSAKGTPSMAIGSYDATPLDMAGAYTVFSNGGVHIDPWTLASVRAPNGDVIDDYPPTSRQVLDPRVAFLTTSMMQAVLQGNGKQGCRIDGKVYCGTGAGVRNMGFVSPAAGKTGTSHDAWFAGFTTNLLCVVWVGNDDYTDIKIEGADAAAPIWADFMKRAVKLPQYSDTHDFTAPDGVDVVKLDRTTNLLSDDACPDSYSAAFLTGTAPTDTCDHPTDHRNILQKLFGVGGKTGE